MSILLRPATEPKAEPFHIRFDTSLIHKDSENRSIDVPRLLISVRNSPIQDIVDIARINSSVRENHSRACIEWSVTE